MAGFACSREPATPATDIWRLRNAGRLHAASDTEAGYRDAALAFRQLAGRTGDPTDALNLARVLILGGDAEGARDALQAFRSGWPAGTPMPHDEVYLDGLIAKGLGDDARAAQRWRELTRLDPRSEPGWFQLGTVLSQRRDFAAAAQAFEALIAINPVHLAAQYKLSMALRAAGDLQKADAALSRFTELKRAAGDASSDDKAYEKCSYTRVRLVPPVGAAPAATAVAPRFESASGSAGLDGVHASAAAVLDHDGDGDPDLYVVRRGPNGLLRNDGGRFTDVTELSDAGDHGDGIAAEPADFNNDGLLDIYVVNRSPASALLKGLGEGVFHELAACGLARQGVVAARWADHDHDGDVDLITLERTDGAAPRLQVRAFRNNGDETFLDVDGLFPGLLTGAAGAIAMADLDQGNDIDFVVSSDGSTPAVFMNLRAGPFHRAELSAGVESPRPLAAAWDWNGDGELDLILAGGRDADIEVCLSGGPRRPGESPRWEQARKVAIAAAAVTLTGADADNDGTVEAVVATDRGVEIAGAGASAPATGLPADATLAAATLDFDLDGRIDILGVVGGRLWLGANRSSAHPAVTIRLIGGRDNRDGVGAHVELRSGARYSRRLVEAAGALGAGLGVPFGLGEGALADLDGFEVLWPNGIAQPLLPADLKWDGRRRLQVTQKRGLTVSCPFLFAHDGDGYRFITDVVGIAPLDEWLPAGGRPHLDPEEFVRIAGDRLRPVGSRLLVAITEELKETTYLDRLKLWRLTHPTGTLCLGTETTLQGAMEPLSVWIVRADSVREPARARSSARGDLTADVAAADGRWAHPYADAPSQWAGWTPEHSFELWPASGAIPPGALLLLSGRIYWPDSSVTFALDQHRRGWMAPRLELVGGGGRAVPASGGFGFPCGMDRLLALPLAPAAAVPPEPGGWRSVRLVTQHRFLWDHAAFAGEAVKVAFDGPGRAAAALGSQRIDLRLEELPLAAAELGFRGISRVVGDMERHEQTYDFADTTAALAFQLPWGRATRYGDVRGLLLEPDSRLVVIPPGDALFSEFGAGDAVLGSATTYFLQVTGWAKESNFHNATGRFIEPLPYHGMESYPPAKPRREAAEAGIGRLVGER